MGTETAARYGFVGAGVIAEVFVRRLLGCGLTTADRILAYDTNHAILTRLAGSFGVQAVASNREVVAGSDIVFIAVPPMAILPVLREVAPELRESHLVFSLAAAVPIALMEQAIGKPVPVIRTIPNTPSWIGRGMTPFCVGNYVGPPEREAAMGVLRSFGRIAELPEEEMGIATALTAVGPTYIFPVIAALSDAAIAHGLPPALALTAACQVVAGAAQLVLESKRSPEGLALLTSLRTLDEPAAKKLFTQAVEDALGKVLAAEAKLRSSSDMGS
ncbi:MAG TPA: pyrroline-5-carboxylate reductase dimerization domain-containing protein [Candidatus Methylomirabilis sp.]|nr:pyrroline-5-carboxylate reductase dimerization domain-containing protein [Candidatus Methylomirabilis sp.]